MDKTQSTPAPVLKLAKADDPVVPNNINQEQAQINGILSSNRYILIGINGSTMLKGIKPEEALNLLNSVYNTSLLHIMKITTLQTLNDVTAEQDAALASATEVMASAPER